MHNVLYSVESKTVTMVDFESIGECITAEDFRNIYEPEMIAIFGPEIMQESRTGE